MLPTDLSPGLRRGREITHRESHHLARAAERLQAPAQRAFFELSYASMRIADDMVDDKFLAMSAVDRQEQRDAARRELDDWLQQIEACAAGSYRPSPGDEEPELFVALNYFLARSSLGPRPWQLLARSLHRDLMERPIESWADYLEYCEGACVAPATVFVFLLGAEFSDAGRSRYTASIPPDLLARDLAIYSYIVHMLRDLHEDSQIHPQLVQIPRVWLWRCGVDLRELRSAAGLLPILLQLRGHALSRREAALRAMAQADQTLRPEAAATLRYVLELYDGAAREVGVLGAARKAAAGA